MVLVVRFSGTLSLALCMLQQSMGMAYPIERAVVYVWPGSVPCMNGTNATPTVPRSPEFTPLVISLGGSLDDGCALPRWTSSLGVFLGLRSRLTVSVVTTSVRAAKATYPEQASG
jgi:hypothetical protein